VRKPAQRRLSLRRLRKNGQFVTTQGGDMELNTVWLAAE